MSENASDFVHAIQLQLNGKLCLTEDDAVKLADSRDAALLSEAADRAVEWLSNNRAELWSEKSLRLAITQGKADPGDATCEWMRCFDGHFSIGCVNKTGQRANGNFKRDKNVADTKWDFKYCPYCGKEIKIIYSD